MTAESPAALKDRAVKQRWAVPGSTHDRIVRWSKIVLPSAVGALVAILAVAPLGKHGDVSFILDKKRVENAQDHMRLEAPRYVGTDEKGREFQITAQHAIQRSSNVPIVDIRGMFARLSLDKGPLFIAANQGRYDIDSQTVAISGPVRVVGPDDYRIATRDVTVDLKDRHMESAGPVTGRMRLGQFKATHMSADLGDRQVVLDGGARLKIVQGAVR